MPTIAEAKHFRRILVKRIKEFGIANPDKVHKEIGIKRDAEGDFIWFREWAIIPITKPRCSVCGKIMAEGSIHDPDGNMGYPIWQCINKKCNGQLIRRYEKELNDYREHEGMNDALRVMMDKMNIPLGYRSKNISNLTYFNKKEVVTAMREGKSIFIDGASGVGKTHLAIALLIEFGRKAPHRYHYRNLPIMFKDLQSMIRNEEDYTKLIDDAITYDCIVLDDLGAEKVTEYKREVLYDIINGRELIGRQTIVTSNLDYQLIKEQYDERLSSRLKAYVHFRLKGKDKRGE